MYKKKKPGYFTARTCLLYKSIPSIVVSKPDIIISVAVVTDRIFMGIIAFQQPTIKIISAQKFFLAFWNSEPP